MKQRNKKEREINSVEKFSIASTNWIGSTASLITHTILFVGAFVMTQVGFSVDRVLLVLTTIVSLEAIYLAIFIQMTINRTTAQLQGVEETVEEISEDIDEIQEDVDEIQEDIDEIQEDVDEISEDEVGDGTKLDKIEQSLLGIVKEIEELKKTRS